MAGEFGINILEYNILNSNIIECKSFSKLGSTYNLIDRVNNLKSKKLDGKKVFELAENGDFEVQKLIEDFYFYLAVGIYNIVYSLAPEKILIGGGLSSRDDLVKNIEDKLKLLNKDILEFVKIDTCKFKNESGKIGALYNFLNKRNKNLTI